MDPTGTERKLAAIVFTDIVGYTALMAESEEKGLRARERHRQLVRPLVEAHHGESIESRGDESLSLLPSALDAVRCALAIQEQVEGDPELRLHLGIHLGDVVVQAGEVSGDGVNIASRICALSEDGGLCVSGEVYQAVRNQPDIEAVSLGEHELRNVGRPVTVYRLTGEPGVAPRPTASRSRSAALALGTALAAGVVGLVLWQLWPDPAGEPTSPESDTEASATDERFTVPGFGDLPAIAVLPFDNLSGDPDQEYFADGIADDLIIRLSRVGRFPVIARNSSFAYRGEAIDVKRVGHELGVGYVVEGSVRTVGERVRIHAQLIDTATARHVWAERYDRELADVLALQDEVTLAIASALGVELVEEEMERALGQGVRDLGAWHAYLRGRWHGSRGKFTEAAALYERALELDPGLAWASHGVVAMIFFRLPAAKSDAEREQLLREAMREAERCLALHPLEPGCHSAMGVAHAAAGERERAIAAFERAIELKPRLDPALVHAWLGIVQALGGRPAEALTNLETALRLSPRDPAASVWLTGLGWAHFAAGRYREAIEASERAHTLAPGHPGRALAYRTLAASYGQLDQLEQARAALEEERRLEPDLSLAKVRAENAGTDPAFLERWLDGLRKAGLPQE